MPMSYAQPASQLSPKAKQADQKGPAIVLVLYLAPSHEARRNAANFAKLLEGSNPLSVVILQRSGKIDCIIHTIKPSGLFDAKILSANGPRGE